MTPDERYPIERFIMTQNDCYKANRRRTPTGIQVHSVGCKGTSRDRWRRWNTPGLKKCANAIIDTKGIMQTLDWDVRPWLSGSGSKGNANDTCVGFEICEPSAANDTPEAAAYLYGCVLYLCTELCRDYGIHPREIKCHSELHREGRASNHADVNHWWGKLGTAWKPYTMPRLRHDVAEALGVDLMEGANIMDTILKKGSSGPEVLELQEMLDGIGYACGTPDGVFGNLTAYAVKSFQRDNNLTVDGVVGPATWAALEKATEPEDPEPAADDHPTTDAETVTVSRDDIQAAVERLEALAQTLRGWL